MSILGASGTSRATKSSTATRQAPTNINLKKNETSPANIGDKTPTITNKPSHYHGSKKNKQEDS